MKGPLSMLKRDSLLGKLMSAATDSSMNGNLEDELIAIKCLLIEQNAILSSLVEKLDRRQSIIVTAPDPIESDMNTESKNKSKKGRPRKDSIFIPTPDTSGMQLKSETVITEASSFDLHENPTYKGE